MSQLKTLSLILALLVLVGVASALMQRGTGLRSPALSEQATTTTQMQVPTLTPASVKPKTQTPALTPTPAPAQPQTQAPTQTTPAQAQAPVSAAPVPPSLTAPIAYSGPLNPELKIAIGIHIAALRIALSQNPNDYSAWMNLALQYKAAGDYNAARDVWEYIGRLYPTRATAFHNLGDLYLRQFNDYAKAESYYKLGIQADPSQAIDYTALFEFYRDFYKQDTTAAADILKEGIARIGGTQAIDLETLLASYYEDKGDTANAILYYTQARAAAQAAGNTDLVARIDAEIATLQSKIAAQP